jgi:hypothetical protein
VDDAFEEMAQARVDAPVLHPPSRVGEGLNLQAVETTEQPLHMLLKSKNPPAVDWHCLKNAITKKKAAVVDRHAGLRLGHIFAVNVSVIV